MKAWLDDPQAQAAAYRLGWTIVHTLWIGAAVWGVFEVALRALHGRAAQGRYLAGCAALALLMVVPVGVYWMVPAPAMGAQGTSTQGTGALRPQAVAEPALPVMPAPAVMPTVMPTGAGASGGARPEVTAAPARPVNALEAGWAERAGKALDPYLPWVVGAWAVGVVMLSGWHMAGWAVALGLRRRARAVEPALAQTAARLGERLGIRVRVQLRETAGVAGPAVMGWLWPVILLPVGFAAGLSPGQVEAILAHELAHIRRHDYLVNLGQAVVETLLFYHPCVWLISRRVRVEREHCCDDVVLAAGAERCAYAEGLVRMARGAGGLRLAVQASGAGVRLRQRVMRVLGMAERARTWPAAAGLVVVAVLAGVLANAAAPGPGPATTQAAVLELGHNEASVRHVVSADGKVMTIHEGDKILFMNGVGAGAKQLSSLDIKGQQARASQSGSAVALCSQFIDQAGPAVVYDNSGRKLGQFDLDHWWKVAGVSDDGQLVALTKVLEGRSPLVVRLCDLKGTVLAEYEKDPTFCTFGRDGIPVVWGANATTRDPFVSVLDKKGKVVATWQYPDQTRWAQQVAASADAAVVAVLDHPKSEPFPDTLTIWRPATGTRASIALPKDLGAIQTDGMAISADGSFVALRLGGTGIGLFSTAKPSVALKKDLALLAGEKDRVKVILRIAGVANDGRMKVHCLLESAREIVLDMDVNGQPEPGAAAEAEARAVDEARWSAAGPDGLRIRLVVPTLNQNGVPTVSEQLYKAQLEVWNTGAKAIRVPVQNVMGGREELLDEWLVGLEIATATRTDSRKEVDRYRRADDRVEQYWSKVGNSPSEKELKPGERASLGIRLHQLVNKDGRKLLEQAGRMDLMPVLNGIEGKPVLVRIEGPEEARGAAADWGPAKQGLRARFIKPEEPIIAGSKPEFVVEVENVGDVVLWPANSQLTWSVHVEGVEPQGSWLSTRFEVELMEGSSPELGRGYGMSKGGKMRLHTTYRYSLDKPGRYQVESQLSRGSPFPTNNVDNPDGYIVCPLMVVEVAEKGKAAAVRAQGAELAGRLSNPDFKVRQAAQRDLVKMGPAAEEALQPVASGKDPEAAARAQAVLKILGYMSTVDGARPTAQAVSPNGAYVALVTRDTHLGLALVDEGRMWFGFDLAEFRYPGLVKINKVSVADNGDIEAEGTTRVKDKEGAVRLLLNQKGDLMDVLSPHAPPLAGQKLGPEVTRELEYVDKGRGNIDSATPRNLLDLDSGQYHSELPSSIAQEGGADVDVLRKAGVDMYMSRMQGGMTMLGWSNLKLIQVAEKAWDGETGLIEEALERADPPRSIALTYNAPARTWAFRTREGGTGVLRAETPEPSIFPARVTIHYRLLAAAITREEEGAVTTRAAVGEAPVGAPAALGDGEAAFYAGLYDRYKAAILADVKAGNTAAVEKKTAEFNASIGGKLAVVYVTRIDGEGKDTQVYAMNEGQRMLPAIKYAREEHVHVTREADYVLLETCHLPPAVPFAPGDKFETRYADDVYIKMGVLPMAAATQGGQGGTRVVRVTLEGKKLEALGLTSAGVREAMGAWMVPVMLASDVMEFDGRGTQVPPVDEIVVKTGNGGRVGLRALGTVTVEEVKAADLVKAFEAVKAGAWREQGDIGLRLIGLGDKSVIAAMVEDLKSPERHVRINAGWVLAGLGDERGLAAITKELNDATERPIHLARSDGTPYLEGQIREDQFHAAFVLGRLKDKLAVPALVKALKGPAAAEAAWALGETQEPSAVPALKEYLGTAGADRLAAARAMGILGAPEGITALVGMLKDASWVERRNAAEALGELGYRAAVPGLIEALKDEKADVRMAAARALGEMGDAAALAGLKAMEGDAAQNEAGKTTTVGEVAREATRKIEAKGVGGATTPVASRPVAEVVWRGVKLSDMPATMDIAKVPDVFEKPAGATAYQERREVTIITFEKKNINDPGLTIFWLKGKNCFYVRYYGVGASTPVYYGPIPGDPSKAVEAEPATGPAFAGANPVATETAEQLVDRLLKLPNYVPDPRVRGEDMRTPLLAAIAGRGEEGAAALVAGLMGMPSAADDPQGTKNAMRWQLIRDIGTLGDAALKPAQEALGKAKTELQRQEMVSAIGAVNSPAATRALLGLLAEKEEAILNQAVSSLTDRLGAAAEQGGSVEVLPALAKIVPEVKTELYRTVICLSMRRVLKPAAPGEADARQRGMAVGLLRERLKNDAAADVRFTAACVLTEFEDYTGLEELKKAALALQAGVGVTNDYALDQLVPALERATGQRFGPVPMNPMASSISNNDLAVQRQALLEKVVAWIKANPGAGTRPATGPATAPAGGAARGGAAPFPPVEDVVVRAEMEKAEIAVGEPVVVRLVYENKGTATYWVEEDHLGWFHYSCTITDSQGKAVPDVFASTGLMSIDGPFSIHRLGPAEKLTVVRLLNECVVFPKADTYTVMPASPLIQTAERAGAGTYRLPRTAAATLRVREADPKRRAADVDALLAAWRKKGELPKGLIAEEYVQSWADQSAERVLATMGEERLIPVFLDEMEGTDWNSVASYGLMGMPDRAKVLGAYEERLAHPETHDVTKLIYRYAEMKAQGAGDLTAVVKQTRTEQEAYRERYLAFLHADKTYGYGKLAAELWAWKTDAFLLSYLLRSKPTEEKLLDVSRRMEGMALGKEDEAVLVPLLESKEPAVRDMGMMQLLGIDAQKYGALVREDRDRGTGRFSEKVWEKMRGGG